MRPRRLRICGWLRRDDTIGRIAPGGAAEPFVQLPAGSIGNGIRVRRDSAVLFVADYTGHNILAVGLPSGVVEVWAHEPTLHQPNDLAITADDLLYASDPNWEEGTGRVWRIGPDRRSDTRIPASIRPCRFGGAFTPR